MSKHKFIDDNNNLIFSCTTTLDKKDEIIGLIKSYLKENIYGCVDHYINDDFVRRYSNNPKTFKPSLEIDKSDKPYYKLLK